MIFVEALRRLGIEDYAENIWESSSTGELFHIDQYSILASNYKGTPEDFRIVFESIVFYADNNWNRPQSVYQHILEILIQMSSLNA